LLSAADPLNSVSILTPGPRVAALTDNRLVYRDGIPVAILSAGKVDFLTALGAKSQWDAENGWCGLPLEACFPASARIISNRRDAEYGRRPTESRVAPSWSASTSVTAMDGEKDCGSLKASSTRRNARTSSLGLVFTQSIGVHQLATRLYNRCVSSSTPPKRIMLSAAARNIDQKYTALADLCGDSRLESAATNHVDGTGFVELDAVASAA
jgi:hypothetical protein